MKISTKLLLVSLIYLLGLSTTFSAGSLHDFEVTLPKSAKIGESVDLSIKAIDVNGNVVSDYIGSVFIYSSSDPEAEFPLVLKDYMYEFLPTDQGVVVFENAIKFTKEGTQDIYVIDFNDEDIYGIGEIKISPGTTSTLSENVDVDIISPEDGLTIGVDKVRVVGNTVKNHGVRILVNGKEQGFTITNDSGTYEKTLENLEEGENIIVVKVVDADENTIGTSKEVTIKIEKGSMSLFSAKVVPEEVKNGEAFELEVIATAGLREVSSNMNDVITKLSEKEAGRYIAKLYAPENGSGTYKIDVILKDELGHEKKELGASSMSVKFTELIEESVPPVENLESGGLLNSPGKDPLKVNNLKLVELKSKSILTWDKVSGAKSYNVYKKLDGNLEFMVNVEEPRFEVLVDMSQKEKRYEYFAVKAVGETSEGEVYEGDLSEATKIQTGPEILILIIISIFVGGLFTMIRQKKA